MNGHKITTLRIHTVVNLDDFNFPTIIQNYQYPDRSIKLNVSVYTCILTLLCWFYFISHIQTDYIWNQNISMQWFKPCDGRLSYLSSSVGSRPFFFLNCASHCLISFSNPVFSWFIMLRSSSVFFLFSWMKHLQYIVKYMYKNWKSYLSMHLFGMFGITYSYKSSLLC